MERHFDFVVVGSGIAGLFYALEVVSLKPDAKVAIVTKKSAAESSTNRAQGGIAAVLSKTDSFELHIKDTLRCGGGLCNEKVVRQVVENGPRVIDELIGYGVKFSRLDDSLDLTREGGHSVQRVVHAGDLTGKEIDRALLNACRSSGRIEMFRNSIVLDLITESDNGKTVCSGISVLRDNNEEIESFLSPVTLLSTGGLCQVYQHNTNPPIATGDGVAMAYRAGATIANLEFVQFHPTAMYAPGQPTFLISEAVRGEGGRLLSLDGRYLMEDAHDLKDLAPRDIVARAIDKELKDTKAEHVLLDISHKGAEFIKERFPHIYATCLKYGTDITKEPIPVVPSAHYACGGLKTDIGGQTEIRGLFASGEVAMTGMHGANRLASNSLLEAVVVSKNAALETVNQFEKLKTYQLNKSAALELSDKRAKLSNINIKKTRSQLTKTMSELVGIVRSEKRLLSALEKIEPLRQMIDQEYASTMPSYELVELRNLVTVAELIIKSGLWRKESRGLHFMEDYPAEAKDYDLDSGITSRISKRRALV
ncbi:MAG: L-aspartate oxidase [candidate division Zixibacteria bacterium]|nr:L-aspartate oxidase [candidate division Zixibacteria bacterium]